MCSNILSVRRDGAWKAVRRGGENPVKSVRGLSEYTHVCTGQSLRKHCQ